MACDDDELTEWRLRKNYPLLCERFLDGYTEAQVARGHMIARAQLQTELQIELYSAKRDPMCKAGPGRALVTMAEKQRCLA